MTKNYVLTLLWWNAAQNACACCFVPWFHPAEYSLTQHYSKPHYCLWSERFFGAAQEGWHIESPQPLQSVVQSFAYSPAPLRVPFWELKSTWSRQKQELRGMQRIHSIMQICSNRDLMRIWDILCMWVSFRITHEAALHRHSPFWGCCNCAWKLDHSRRVPEFACPTSKSGTFGTAADALL